LSTFGGAWGLALHKARLVFASGLHPQGAEVELRLQLSGAGFLLCTGGFSQAAALPVQINAGVVVPVPTVEERQRVGSLRSRGMVATQTGLHPVEHMVAGCISSSLFRQLVEQDDGGLAVRG